MSTPLIAALGWSPAASSGWPIAMLGWGEMILIGIFALLIFGKRLPEVARSLGKGVVEFKKGIRGIETDVEQATSMPEPTRQADMPEPTRQAAAKELPSAVPEKPPIEPEKAPAKAEAASPSSGSGTAEV